MTRSYRFTARVYASSSESDDVTLILPALSRIHRLNSGVSQSSSRPASVARTLCALNSEAVRNLPLEAAAIPTGGNGELDAAATADDADRPPSLLLRGAVPRFSALLPPPRDP